MLPDMNVGRLDPEAALGVPEEAEALVADLQDAPDELGLHALAAASTSTLGDREVAAGVPLLRATPGLVVDAAPLHTAAVVARASRATVFA
jgi:hypothetical protein